MEPLRRTPVLLVMALMVFGAASAAGPAGGAQEGTSAARNVILVHDIYELQNLSQDLNASYQLANDIDASETISWDGGKGFVPLGSYQNPFMGSFDGHGYNISDVHSNRSGYGGSIFGDVGPGADISIVNLQNHRTENLRFALVDSNRGIVAGCTASGNFSADSPGSYAPLVRFNERGGMVTDCKNYAIVSGTSVAGLVGNNTGTVTGCQNYGSVTGSWMAGGLVSVSSSDIVDCVNTGEVSGQLAGGVLGENLWGTVDGCRNDGVVWGNGVVGGLVGLNMGTVSNCRNTGDIWGRESAGGIVGENSNYYAGSEREKEYATVMNCNNSGVISGPDSVGGIAGTNGFWANITACYNKGPANEGNATGGIAGSNINTGSGIYWCGNSGPVTGLRNAGGVAGFFNGTISKCYNSASVSGTENAGGLGGRDMYGNVSDCSSNGSVSGAGNVGGLIGYYDGYEDICTVVNCYSAGAVAGPGSVGGLLGYRMGWNTSCYWDTQASGQAQSAGGDGKTTAEMKKQATFAGWDFINIWKIEEDVTYPYLREVPSIPANRAPTVTTVPPGTATVGSLYSVQFSASDPDGDVLEWSMTSEVEWLWMTGTGLLSGVPRENSTGTWAVAISVSDGRGGLASITFELSVSAAPANHDPAWSSVPPNATLNEGDDFRSSAAATDADGDAITYGLTTSPACPMTVNPATGALEWLNISEGEYVCVLTATDGRSAVSLAFMLKVGKKPVQPVNRAPEIAAVSAPENRTVRSSETLTLSADATDADGDNLTYEWKENNVTVSTEKSFSRKFSPGNHSLVLLIGDGHYVTMRTFNFTVAPPPKTIETGPVSVPGFGAGAAAAAVTVVALGLFWRRERR